MNKNQSINTKLKHYETVVKPAILYGVEINLSGKGWVKRPRKTGRKREEKSMVGGWMKCRDGRD